MTATAYARQTEREHDVRGACLKLHTHTPCADCGREGYTFGSLGYDGLCGQCANRRPIVCDAQPWPHRRYQECDNPRGLPETLTHAHAGGTVHNHEQYSAEQMPAEWAEHMHHLREDWNKGY